MKLFIAIPATERHFYATRAQASRVQACLHLLNDSNLEVEIYLTGDGQKVEELASHYEQLFSGWLNVEVDCEVCSDYTQGEACYDKQSQLLVAQLRTECVNRARAANADYLWFLDSDVLPPANALDCLFWALKFDRGYYEVAFGLYPSQGGGPFLGGRGTPESTILPNVYPEERIIPGKLALRMEALTKRRDELRAAITERDEDDKVEAYRQTIRTIGQIQAKLERFPAQGDVQSLNSRKWRKRGWFDFAYPAIGKGAMVPIDWCGFGCTLLTRRALAFCDFSGYDGTGTEDLYVIWRKWHNAGIRIAGLPHVLCDHVIRVRGSEKYVIVECYHERQGECVGHLRQRNRPFYDHRPGERFDPANDGIPNHAPVLKVPERLKSGAPTSRFP